MASTKLMSAFSTNDTSIPSTNMVDTRCPCFNEGMKGKIAVSRKQTLQIKATLEKNNNCCISTTCCKIALFCLLNIFRKI